MVSVVPRFVSNLLQAPVPHEVIINQDKYNRAKEAAHDTRASSDFVNKFGFNKLCYAKAVLAAFDLNSPGDLLALSRVDSQALKRIGRVKGRFLTNSEISKLEEIGQTIGPGLKDWQKPQLAHAIALILGNLHQFLPKQDLNNVYAELCDNKNGTNKATISLMNDGIRYKNNENLETLY